MSLTDPSVLAEDDSLAQPEEIIDRDPLPTALISIIPGAGHVYVGQTSRGIFLFVLTLVQLALIYWTSVTAEMEVFPGMIPVLGVLLGIWWTWQAASAVNKATKKQGFLPAIGLASILAFTYIIGWQATEINVEKFITEFPDTFRIFTLVMWPWEQAFERDAETVNAETEWVATCDLLEEADEERPPQTQEGERWLTIEPACGEVTDFVIGEGLQYGTEVTIEAGGFEPGTVVELYWQNPIGDESRPRVYEPNVIEGAEQPLTEGEAESDSRRLRVVPNEQGEFEVTFISPQGLIPDVAQGPQTFTYRAEQVASLGSVRVSDDFQLAIDRVIVTIFQALMATTFGVVLAVPLSFLAARNLMYDRLITRIIYQVVRFVMNVTRSIEPLIWGVIAVVWVGLGPFAGVIALMIHTIAALGKLYSESIESIEDGPIEAITATGATRIQTIVYAIVPQIIPPYLSFTLYRWDINVRMSTIIGFIGGGGIGQILSQWIAQTRWSSAGMAVWLIAITVSVLDFASAELRKRFI
jgi:phosphonate transport system permease protein